MAGLGGPAEKRSLFNVTKANFENPAAVIFAMRLNGKLIGEAALCRFNYRGDAGLECRIAREYNGHGYGTEAVAIVADWSLYKVRFMRVVSVLT